MTIWRYLAQAIDSSIDILSYSYYRICDTTGYLLMIHEWCNSLTATDAGSLAPARRHAVPRATVPRVTVPRTATRVPAGPVPHITGIG